MAEARPLLVIAGGSVVACLLLAGWWGTRPALERWGRLAQIARQEHSRSQPPWGLEDQTRWLLTHRRSRLQSLAGLVGLAMGIGIGEGMRRRSQDVWRGMRLTRWTCGLVGLALLPGLSGALLLWPAPWPLVPVASASAMWSGGMMFFLINGRPDVR